MMISIVAARRYQPRLLHLAIGNASNDAVLAALLADAGRINDAFLDPAVGVVTVG